MLNKGDGWEVGGNLFTVLSAFTKEVVQLLCCFFLLIVRQLSEPVDPGMTGSQSSGQLGGQ